MIQDPSSPYLGKLHRHGGAKSRSECRTPQRVWNPQPYVSVGQLWGREQGNRRKCSQTALVSALRIGVRSGVLPRALSRLLFLLFSAPRATSRALLGALPRAPRFLRALSRAVWEHFRRFPCSRLASWPRNTQPQLPNRTSKWVWSLDSRPSFLVTRIPD